VPNVFLLANQQNQITEGF